MSGQKNIKSARAAGFACIGSASGAFDAPRSPLPTAGFCGGRGMAPAGGSAIATPLVLVKNLPRVAADRELETNGEVSKRRESDRDL